MALFEVTERDREIYEKELRDFLPEKILDVHTHMWLDKFLPDEMRKAKKRWPQRVANENSVEDLQETYQLLFPGKDVKALSFTTTRGGWVENNRYVAESVKKSGWYGLYYSHPDEVGDDLIQKIKAGGFLGIKSYENMSPSYIPRKEVRVFDFFPKKQMETLNEIGGVVMLHIPRDGRLKDPVNLEQILELKREFPNVKLILAHVGRAYTQDDVANAFTDYLNKEPGLMYDFSANCCDFAIKEVIKNAGVKNVMFGTDMPVLRMRTHRIEENGTYINIVPRGLYGDESEDSHLRAATPEEAEKITFFVYEELLSFKRVAQELNLSKQDVENIMYNNAFNLLSDARRSIYGE